MSNEVITEAHASSQDGDDKADAFAAVALIAIVVATVAYWLSGMPV